VGFEYKPEKRGTADGSGPMSTELAIGMFAKGQKALFLRVHWNMEFDVILESRTGRNHCTADL
jgi:hypothetical protein